MAYASSPQLAFRAAFSSTLQKTKFYIALHFDAIHKVHVRQKKTGSFRFRLIRDVHRERNDVDWLDAENWHCVFPLAVETSGAWREKCFGITLQFDWHWRWFSGPLSGPNANGGSAWPD